MGIIMPLPLLLYYHFALNIIITYFLSEVRKATFSHLITRKQHAAALKTFINMPIFILVYNLNRVK